SDTSDATGTTNSPDASNSADTANASNSSHTSNTTYAADATDAAHASTDANPNVDAAAAPAGVVAAPRTAPDANGDAHSHAPPETRARIAVRGRPVIRWIRRITPRAVHGAGVRRNIDRFRARRLDDDDLRRCRAFSVLLAFHRHLLVALQIARLFGLLTQLLDGE